MKCFRWKSLAIFDRIERQRDRKTEREKERERETKMAIPTIVIGAHQPMHIEKLILHLK